MVIHFDRDISHDAHCFGPQGRQFAACSVAHELCNHLQVVASAIGLLERGVGYASGPDLDFIFSGARTSLERASALSRQLVDGDQPEARKCCSISIAARLSALQETVLLVAGPAIFVEYEMCKDLPEVFCSEQAFDDAVLNIVVNAGRAMPSGGRISITTSLDPAIRDGLSFAVLRIADTGYGMPAEIAARAFDPRFTTRPNGQGSGLGLSAVASFARSAGGSAELESRPGIGTIVTLRLPAELKVARALQSD
ncbi:hypothetical protein KZX46_00375 (plasmid) [Polymorphobacter sp. PAMC 29334]|uniref:sensor histidine kinase n=1 Tax=Polymorphobacter sp. PAMC 29334 TaxID=2862331 RepID=UPI001C78AE7B|nr:ATP-binding protein [Polymorphobacter sp. PAMC 29334]QYE33300.1 hypothetical protein KZX46_00375 [Polymorphobacter sp. PAMC 29334]